MAQHDDLEILVALGAVPQCDEPKNAPRQEIQEGKDHGARLQPPMWTRTIREAPREPPLATLPQSGAAGANFLVTGPIE
jgi:hypothetical protein